MMARTIEPLTDDARQRIRGQVEQARQFVAAHVPGEGEEAFSLLLLDEALAEWLSAEGPEAKDTEATVEAVGAAFGDFLVRGLGFSWVSVRDEETVELAVHGLPGEGDVLIFPQHLVASTGADPRPHFLTHSYRQIAAHVRVLRRGRKA